MNTGIGVKAYSSRDVSAAFGPLPMMEPDSDDFISIDYTGESVTAKQGAYGSIVLSEQINEIVDITIKLQSTSSYNDYLSGIFKAQKIKMSAGLRTFTLKDMGSTTIVFCPSAIIVKSPPLGYGKEAGTSVWKIKGFNPKIHNGGAILSPPLG